MEDNNKAVGPLAAAKLVALIKAMTAKKYDNTGGKIDGSAEITGDVHAGGAVQSDLLLSAPSVTVHNGAGESVHINCSGDNAAGISSLGSDGKSHYSRLAVGTPTGDNDATTKAYVDGKAHDYYDVTVTSSADAAQTIDGGIIDVRGSADKTVAEISAAYAAGAIVRCIYGGNIMQLVRAEDGNYAFAGVGANWGVARSGNITITIRSTSTGDVTWITSAAGELPIPDSDASQNGCALVVRDGQWMYSEDKLVLATPTSNGLMSKADKTKLDDIERGANKTTIDSAMSGSSVNPVQNKVIKQYIDDKVAAAGSNITVDAELSATSTNPAQNKAVKAAIGGKADKTALNAKMDKSGGTFTGNVHGKYFCGTWLQSTEASDLGRTPGKIAVMDDSGWVYYRTPAELFADLGIANEIKSYVDAAIIVAINSAY